MRNSGREPGITGRFGIKLGADHFPAIHMDHLPGNIRGIVRCKIDIGRRQFEWLPGAFHWDISPPLGTYIFSGKTRRDKWCPDWPGSYCINTYSLINEVE